MKPSDIKFIVVHAADTKPSMDIGVKEIREWHTKERGWSDIGYHFVIRRNGDLENGRDLSRSGAHVRGYNSVSWGICMVGGMAENGSPDCNYTKIQYATLELILTELSEKAPLATIAGHRDFDGVTKTCPNFNVKEFYYVEDYD
jgi:N-acetyl-anhydromuramyl-L-alanine amidase AmpD